MSTMYRITRWIDRCEVPWLPYDVIGEGEVVYRCTRPTYGAVTPRGVAVTFDPSGDYPFFEVPRDALREVE